MIEINMFNLTVNYFIMISKISNFLLFNLIILILGKRLSVPKAFLKFYSLLINQNSLKIQILIFFPVLKCNRISFRNDLLQITIQKLIQNQFLQETIQPHFWTKT